MVRNEARQSKFDPKFGPEWNEVIEVEESGIVCQDEEGKQKRRHTDDVKIEKRKMTKRRASKKGNKQRE